MRKIHGIMGSAAVLLLLAAILLFIFVDHPYKSNPTRIVTEAFVKETSNE